MAAVLVDDERAILKFASGLLQMSGHEALTAIERARGSGDISFVCGPIKRGYHPHENAGLPALGFYNCHTVARIPVPRSRPPSRQDGSAPPRPSTRLSGYFAT